MTPTQTQLLESARKAVELAKKAKPAPWTKSTSFAGATVYAGSPATGAKGLIASFDTGDYANSIAEGNANAELTAHARTFSEQAAEYILASVPREEAKDAALKVAMDALNERHTCNTKEGCGYPCHSCENLTVITELLKTP